MTKKVKLKELCKITNGFAFKSEKYVHTNGARVIRITNVQKGRIVDNEPKLYPFSELQNLDEYKISEGDILMSLTGNVGRVGIFPKELLPAYINQRVCRVQSANEKLSNNYLFHFFNSDDFEKDAVRNSAGAAQLNLSSKWIENLQIPLPPIEQQKKIAAILDAADSYRQKTKALIAKYDELTQSLFLDMFGDPVSNEKGFELSSVGIQCKVKGGKRVPKNEKLVSENTGFPYIKAGNIKSGKVTLKDLEFLLPQTRERLKRYTVEKGDVCITVVGANIGDVGIVPDELHLANLTENANKILIKDKNVLNNYFLSKYLQMDFIQKNIGAKTMAVGVPKLALFRIEQIELLIPPISLQKQYKERVQVIESQKAKAQASLEKAEELFNSLLQRAFKGELV